MKTWAWASALLAVAGAGGSVWALWFRAATYCSGPDTYDIACVLAATDATMWSWVAVGGALVLSIIVLWFGREARRGAAPAPNHL